MTEKNTLREYHARDGLTKTKLWQLYDRSPQYYKYCLDHPEVNSTTPALLFGAALHKAVLEPESFADEYAVAPNCDRRTKEGKAAYQAFLDSCGERDIILADDKACIDEMVAAIRANPLADFLTRGEVETSYYWTDELTGFECQARPDCFKLVDGRGIIADLKTCTRADTDSIIRACINFGYDMQASMFKEAVEKERGVPCDFILVCIEKEPPYMINIIQLDEELISHGYDRFRTAIGMYKECMETGNWYGYNGFSGNINKARLPAWLTKEGL